MGVRARGCVSPAHPGIAALPPQIARDPDLHAAAHARGGGDDGPHDGGTLLVLEDREREVGGGPADGL